MARYIDAEQIVSKLFPVTITTDLYGQGISAGIDQALRIIKEQPTADVEEVNHAKWEINCDGYYPFCSNCKTEPENGVMSKRCPECGAKMDGGEAE